jgi:hypothetical protein
MIWSRDLLEHTSRDSSTSYMDTEPTGESLRRAGRGHAEVPNRGLPWLNQLLDEHRRHHA